MKRIKFQLCAVAMASLLLVSCNQSSYTGEKSLSSRLDSVSYALGVNQGAMLNNDLGSLPKLSDDTSSINREIFLNAFLKAECLCLILFITHLQRCILERDKNKTLARLLANLDIKRL